MKGKMARTRTTTARKVNKLVIGFDVANYRTEGQTMYMLHTVLMASHLCTRPGSGTFTTRDDG